MIPKIETAIFRTDPYELGFTLTIYTHIMFMWLLKDWWPQHTLDETHLAITMAILKNGWTAGTKTDKSSDMMERQNFPHKPDICRGVGVMRIACYANVGCSPMRLIPAKLLAVLTSAKMSSITRLHSAIMWLLNKPLLVSGRKTNLL